MWGLLRLLLHVKQSKLLYTHAGHVPQKLTTFRNYYSMHVAICYCNKTTNVHQFIWFIGVFTSSCILEYLCCTSMSVSVMMKLRQMYTSMVQIAYLSYSPNKLPICFINVQYGDTSLMYAAGRGHIAIVKYLVEGTTVEVNATNNVSIHMECFVSICT